MNKKKNDVVDLIKNAISTSSIKDVIDENSYQVKQSYVKSSGKIVDFNGEHKRKLSGIRTNLAEWNNRDFSLYMKKKYKESFKVEWQPSIINITVNINSMKQAVYDIVGFCDNVTLKEYIDSFFAKWASFYTSRSEGVLYVNQFKQSDAIVDFASRYDRNEALQKYKSENKKEKVTESSLDNMEKSYLLGLDNFVLDYGVVFACNWLMIKKSKSRSIVANEVARSLYKLYNNKSLDNALKNTEKYSPYPNWMPFKQHDVILTALGKKIEKSFSLNIEYLKGITKYDFIKEKR